MTAGETRVYGASDDLIELDGAIYDEFDAYEEVKQLTFDNGVVLVIQYADEGIWRIEDRSLQKGLVVLTKCEDREGYDGPDGKVYSDEAVVAGATKVKVKKIGKC